MTPTRKIGIGAFLLGSVVGGAIGINGLASAASNDTTTTTAPTAVADDSTSTSTSASTSTTGDATDDTGDTTDTDTGDLPAVPAGPHTANGITEELLTGDTASSVQAAVLATYPDATVDRLETDAEGAAYEAHVTLADGSRATIKLDAAFTVTATETGPDGHGGGPRSPHDDANDETNDGTDSTAATTATADA